MSKIGKIEQLIRDLDEMMFSEAENIEDLLDKTSEQPETMTDIQIESMERSIGRMVYAARCLMEFARKYEQVCNQGKDLLHKRATLLLNKTKVSDKKKAKILGSKA